MKAKFNNPTMLSRYGGFQRTMCLTVEPPNTAPSTNPILTPLLGMKKFSVWDNNADGAPGRHQMLRKAWLHLLATLKQNIMQSLMASDHNVVNQLATGYHSMVI